MGEVHGSSAPPWSNLLPDLLGLVFLCLPTRTDRAFFTAVCRTWCSAARQCRLPSLSPVPWLLCPDGSATSFPHGETFQLPKDMRYHKSCGEWLLLSRNDGSCSLMNHFTKATMPLPSLSSYRYYREPVETSEDYTMSHYHELQVTSWLNNSDTSKAHVHSIVVCSTRIVAAIVAIRSFRTIALCRPGASAWSVSAYVECSQLSDMVFLQGKIYSLDTTNGTGDLIAIDIVDGYDNEPRVSRIVCVIEGISLPRKRQFLCVPYLLESHGTLLIIYRNVSYKIERGPRITMTGSSKFVVFEVDLERHSWTEMRTLGHDRALFLGRGCSRAVHVSPYDLSRDCIFFLDGRNSWFRNWKNASGSCEVYDMKDEKVYSPLPLVSWNSGKSPATWLFSQGETDKLQTEAED